VCGSEGQREGDRVKEGERERGRMKERERQRGVFCVCGSVWICVDLCGARCQTVCTYLKLLLLGVKGSVLVLGRWFLRDLVCVSV